MPYTGSKKAEIEARQAACLSDMKRHSERFQRVAKELEGRPHCTCANGVCDCGKRALLPPRAEVEELTFEEWLAGISFSLEQ